MIADVADYSEWKNNRRATAIIFSAMMVGLKVGLSLGGAILTWILGLYHYVPNSTVQAPEAIQGTKMLVSVYPGHSVFDRRRFIVFLFHQQKNGSTN